MKTCKRRVVVYLDMQPMETKDDTPCGISQMAIGPYHPPVCDGSLRNRIEIEVTVPVRNEVVDCGTVVAETEHHRV